MPFGKIFNCIFIYSIFEEAEKKGINIDMISQNDVSSEHGSFAFTCPKSDYEALEKIGEILKEKFPDISFIINPCDIASYRYSVLKHTSIRCFYNT